MHRKRIGKVYSLIITMMIILSPLTSIFLWEGIKSAVAENPLTPVTTITGLNNDDNFGWNVSWIGDVNGDGYDDIIVGAPYTDRYSGGGDWWDKDWSYRRKLTFDNSGQSEDLVNFPVLVNLSSSNFDYSKAKLDGTDLRFIDSDGSTQLKNHIEKWNTTGSSYIWVNVTSIDGASSTDYIWMYYGNPAASDIQDVSGTYDANYVGVWHLNETSGNATDSTPYNTDGAFSGGVTQGTTGQIDGAYGFDGIDGTVNMGDPADGHLDIGSGSFTIGIWMLVYDSGGSWIELIDKGANSPIETGYCIEISNAGPGIDFDISDGTDRVTTSDVNFIFGEWMYYVAVVNRTDDTVKLYKNGSISLTEDIAIIDNVDSDHDFIISEGSDFYNGTIDEVRISNVARSADWIKAQYLSINNSFITYSGEETKDWWNTDWSYCKKLTFDNSGQSENLVNFPVLVKLELSNFDYSKAKSNGSDLRFIDDENLTELNYEIESWNSSGNSFIWVNVTNITAGSSSDHIWMYYGNSNASDGSNPEGVWDANYVGVWHLKEDPEDPALQFKDSTSYGNNGTAQGGLTSDDQVDGKIDGTIDFDGGSERIDVPDDSSLDFGSNSDYTLSAWIKSTQSAVSGEWPQIMVKRTTGVGEQGYAISLHHNGPTNPVWKSSLFIGGTQYQILGANDVADGNWHYLVVIRKGSDLFTYEDGVYANTTAASSGDISNNQPFQMGKIGGDLPSHAWSPYDGNTTEVRVSNIARSADWIKAQYLSINNSFIMYGSEELNKIDTGAAYIFFGYPGITLNNPNASNANVTIYGSNAGDLFGWSVADAGDVNNDGYDDIIIGAPGWGADRGRAYIFHGRATSSWSATYDADADADVILTGENDGDKFGFSVSGAGDMNNDGLSGDFYESYSYRKKITVNSSKVAENLTDFPVLISIIDSDLKSRARSDGFDILFTESDGKTKLDHEIERYNNSSGELVVWVKVPYLTSTANKIMYMYYGNPIASDQSNPPGVWTNGYRGVWHLSETSGYALDSTFYSTNGTISGTLTQGDTGKIDGAYTLESNGNDNIDMGDPIDGHLDFGTGSFTLSVWVKDYPYTNYQNVVFKGSRSSIFPTGYSLYHRANDGEASWSIGDNTARVQNDFDWDQDGTWRYIVGVANRSNDLSHAYVNGVEQGTPVDISSVGSVDSDFNFAIPGSSSYLDATVDEVRISSGARSLEWIETEYNNQNDTSMFYTVGTEEIIPVNWLYRKQITIKASQVTGDLTDFPVLISTSDSDLKSKARSDGYDIIFTDSDGRTKLDHEVERYNSSSGELIAWVKIPSLSSSYDTVIYMYYGNSMMISPTANPEGVWSNGYVGVYHMMEEIGSINNSASSTNDGTRINTPTRDTGKIGYGQNFTGGGADDCFNISDLGLVDGFQEDLTISAWLNIDDSALEDWARVVNKRDNANSADLYSVNFDNQASNKDINFVAGGDSGSSSIAKYVWVYITFTYNGSVKVHYQNGSWVRDDTGGSGPLSATPSVAPVYIGSRWGPTANYGGILDEVRLSKVARSLEWIETEYNNQNDTSSFFTVGNEEIIPANWLYRKSITINSSRVTEDLTDFPMLVNIIDSDIQSKARSDGFDIVFTESDGRTKLDHEIESYNSGSGELVAWVRIPVISSVTDTVIYMYYGNSNASDQQNMEGVWSKNYRGVWHLAETSGLALDSTSYGLNGTLSGTINRGVKGPIGNAYQFDGTDGIVTMGNPADRHLDFGTGNFTVSVWVNVTQYIDYQYFVYKGGGSDSNNGYTIYYRPTGGQGSVSVSDGTPPRVKDDFDPIENESVYLVLVADRSTNELYAYLNGVLQPDINSISLEGDINDSSDLRFSRAASEVNGIIDEVRISSVARSAAWIQAEYNNTNDTSTFYTLGNEESNVYNDDVIVGAYGYAGESGRAYVFFGGSGFTGEISAGNADVIINSTAPNDRLGWDVSRAGDVNNYGSGDVIIGAPGNNSNTGAAYIFYGNDFMPSLINDIDANVTITGGCTGDEFGFSLSVAYDLNDDGYDDLIVGAPGNNSDTGAAYIFFGSDSLSALISVIDANVTMNGEFAGDRFGYSVNNAGDLNGDGTPDVIVGAPFYDDGAKTDAGAIFVFEGGPSMNGTVDWSYKGEYANDHLGWSVSFAGNVNGDGLTYLIAGAPHNDDGGVDAGKAYLLTMMPTKPVITNILATPSIQNIDGYVNITCDVAAVSGVDSVWVNITLPGGGFTNVSMTQGFGNQWYYNNNYTIPGLYQYTIRANDTFGNWTESGIFFFEVVNSLPSLSSSQINPTVGYTDTGFNFSVIYTDLDNHAPNNITVNITGIGFYDLIEFDPSDTNYTDGKAYYYNASGFAVGSYSFHFAANDTIGDWTETGILSFDVVESGPTILLEQVNPTTGYTDTRFNFTVTYLHLDNQPPNNITVNITGVGTYDLIEVDPLDTDYSDGKDYYYNASGFGVGQYSFHFAANDTNGNWNESSILIFEVLNREPMLSLEQVIPATGYIDTWFNFTVTYTDADNHSPDIITVNITGVGVNDLIELDPLDTDYTDGKAYYYNVSGFAIGSYTFHFAANDTFGNWIESGILQFDVINRGPMLSLEQVDPTTGYIDTWFNFTVTYTDLDNHAPDLISVNITGIGIYNLLEADLLDTDYNDGKEYYYNFSGLAVGSYTFHFAANDTIGNWIESSILQFDVVNRIPVLTSGQVNPSVGDIDTAFNFTVIYTDLDNDVPNMITLNITGIGVYDLIGLDPSDTNYIDGKAYYYNISGLAIGSYTFHFAANDTFGNWTESGILQFDVINRGPLLSLEEVDPIIGYLDTWFNFSVTYTDLDNHALDIITVNITGVGVYDLIEVDPSDIDYSDGKEYYYNTSGFTLGQYSFHFAANDTFRNWTESGVLQFDVVNRVPVLSSGQVNPSVGDIDTAFNLTVTYTDLDNHAPDIITVNITGIGICDLIEVDPLDADYMDGKAYYFNTSGFAIGSYSFHFSANDTQGDWVESVVMNFDVIDRIPTLLSEQIDPTTGYLDTRFNFTVTYVDLDNHAPVTITVNITGIGVFDLIEVDPLDTDYTDGKGYYYNLSGFTVGSYTFHFAANETIGYWVESGILQFDVLNRAPILTLGQVDPTIGYSDTWFNFTVNYTDLDNHAPLNITLNLSGPSGGIFALVEVDSSDTDYTDGKEYYYNTTLSSGLYSFHFTANDLLGMWALETIEINAPDIIPKHGMLDAIDYTGEFSDEIFLNATLLDDDTDPISNENVAFYIDVNKNGLYEAGEYAGAGTTQADGSLSVIYTTHIAAGIYNFKAIYIGSGDYVVENDEALLIINTKQAVLTAISDVVDVGEDIYLTALLVFNGINPIANEQVEFYVDKNKNGIYDPSEFIGLNITSAGGVASVTYSVNLAPDNYGIWARYVGSANFTVSEFEGLLSVQNIGNSPPSILGIVPDQIKIEDSLPWPLDLTPYEVDLEDSGPDLKWYLTGINTSLYSVTGMNSSDDIFTFIPVPDAFGNDEVTLWLWDSDGDRVSQVLWINITPVNDQPYFEPLPPNIFVHYDDPNSDEDDPSPWDYTFYVHDVETPTRDLILTTSEPTVDSGQGYAEVDGLKVTFHYPQSMVGKSIPVVLTLSDGIDNTHTMIWVNITSDWVPELVDKLPDIVLEENTTLYNVFDLDDYFIDKDQDSLYFSSGYFHIKVDINENNTVDITAIGDWTGSELVTFRAWDPIGAMAEDTITVTVIPVNNPPEISGVPNLVVHYDYSYAFDLSPYIFDIDNITSELIVWTSESTDYVWLQQLNNLGIVVNYPESMNGMIIPVTIYVSDGIETTSQGIQISVTSDFPPELINNLPDVFFDEDTVLKNAFLLSDYFIDIDGDVLYYTNGTKFINVSINDNLTVDFSAPANWYGSEVVTFRATDPMGALAEDKILVVVVPVNDPPTIGSIPKQEKNEGDQWVLDLSQYIDDVDNDVSELIISVDSEVGQGYVNLAGNILIFQYPEGIQEDIITITVNDGELEASRSFIVDIKSSVKVAPSIWDMIPWPWVFLFLICAIGGAFAFYRKWSVYLVYEAFLIHEKGLPIAHASQEEISELEDVVVSGMFTAVQNFISDAFSGKTSEDDWELDEMKFGDNKILIERSHNLYLAVIFEGNGQKLRNHVKRLLRNINKEYGMVLEDWDGDMAQLEGISAMIASLISKKESKLLRSEHISGQPKGDAYGEEFEDAFIEQKDTWGISVEELDEFIVGVEGSLLVGGEVKELEAGKLGICECPVCGKEIEEHDTKCPRCGVGFASIQDLQLLHHQKQEDKEIVKSSKEDENHED
jgi:hypothetical protein